MLGKDVGAERATGEPMPDADVTRLGTIALFGAAGAIGQALAPVLALREAKYRVVGRNLAALQIFDGAERVEADFLSGRGVDEAAAGVDTIVYLAGAPYTNFEQHPVMTRNALAAAARAGVSRFVHVAPVYSYGLAKSNPVPELQPHVPISKKGRFRLEQEQLVLQAGAPLRTLVLHLPDFYGPHAENSFADYFIAEAVSGKPASFIGPLNVEREFVFVPDVADPLLRLAACDDAYGTCWNLGGVSPITGAHFAELVYNELGRPKNVRAVPKVALQLIGIFNPLMREVAEMYYLNTSPLILDDRKIHGLLGGITKTTYDEGVHRTIQWMTARQ